MRTLPTSDGLDIRVVQLYVTMKKDTNLARFLADWKDLKPALLYAGFSTVAADEIETGYQYMGEDISKDRFSVVPRIMDDLFRQGNLADFLTEIIRRAGRPKFQDEFLEHLQPLGLDWDRTTNKIRATGEVAEAKKETILGEAKTQNAKVGERGAPSDTAPTWDLFICHASEDKNDVARPLAEELASRGLSVWYDEFTLTLGDSLSRSIDHGLANSRFGVVILSPSFFKKEWPRRELDGLSAKEVSSGKTILPIWHNVDREYVLGYSPVLADKLAVSTSEGLDRVVDEIQKAVSKAESLKDASTEDVTPPYERPSKGGSKAIPSITATVEAVKRYVADPRSRIQLHDLVHEETESVYRKLASNQFPSKIDPFTKEIFQERMHAYETIVERLAAMVAALSYHDVGDHSNLLTRCIERLAEIVRFDGLAVLLDLQFYPALLVTYATGLSALAANRFQNLAAILKDPKYYNRYIGKNQPVIRDVNVSSVFGNSGRWVPRPEAEREYTPASNYIFDLLRPVLREYQPSEKKYEETFDIFEYLLALTYCDIVETKWAPVGRFGWRAKWPGTIGISEFVVNGRNLGEAWQLLRAGFFNGSAERFSQIVEAHKDLLQEQVRSWI